MRLLRALLATVLPACSLVLLAPAPPASACSCVGGTLETFAARADVVFIGTLTATPAAPDEGSMIGSGDPVTYVFDVDTVFQGDAGATAEVESARFGPSCGMENMQAGTSYLMFAELGTGQTLESGLCSGNRQASPKVLQRFTALMGPGSAPSTTAPTPTAATGEPRGSGDDPDAAAIVVLAGAGVLGLGVAGWVLARRRGVGTT